MPEKKFSFSEVLKLNALPLNGLISPSESVVLAVSATMGDDEVLAVKIYAVAPVTSPQIAERVLVREVARLLSEKLASLLPTVQQPSTPASPVAPVPPKR